jgi:uncharacterized membrane protein
METIKYEVKFSAWLQQTFELYKDNVGLLIVSGLLAAVVGGATMGILAGPMAAGLCMIALALVDKTAPKPTAGDVFKGFQFFLPTFLLMLAVGIICVVAAVLAMVVFCLAPVVYAAVAVFITPVMMLALPLIVDQQLDAKGSVLRSLEILKMNFWPMLGYACLAGVLSSAGSIACGIGVIVTMPLGTLAMAVAYRDIVKQLSTPTAPATTGGGAV